ncbi:RING finger and transmembrane domain-containing protein 2-like isoform X1 [Temnothorax curvispinosus]|uniref:RING finger and transmembrane domain-containing protein 2-like isoform X1 n=1 Tax=Temnothorax curvispinosus TaxID=300111 RepID=A0A6J1QF98_9HYME|nr:RING finger and transmembrane domain-containing protein 2-like isoform X1 [Temnothorax curvispinosus]XP_024881014.1 RING finger and transmembrane domain-containing protein 2-like isoform X1 [Temnothorax curvispinosus]XP_024881015.1 RING finger and transmembrane domain-containing protein 2-like isoform X1 [Temnothorax curvispinosus]XP_024881016.1 RING finger and transmembrane domain-containing protein 2-like isoform X1 [Temnothorax curvispinosus]XP_024881017.1 RING finger and transmembrane do
MAENRPIEETASGHCDSRMPHILTSDENENGQIQESPSGTRYTLAGINPGTAFNFGVRTAERSRIFAGNISSTIQGIRPLIQQAAPNITLTSLLAIHGLRNQVQPVTLPSDSYVINLEEPVTNGPSSHDEPRNHRHHHHTASTMPNSLSSNAHEAANEVAENHNNAENTANGNVQIGPEARALLKHLQQYVPFVIILLAKSLYDHRAGILTFIVLLVTFIHANNDLKREIAKQHNRSWSLLTLILCYITACIVFVVYTFNFYTLAPYAEPLTIWDLLCYVTVMDFFLKLITIVCKVLLTCLPVRLLAFQNRGKYYLMVEAMSQLYRCVAPVQPWLYYLLETYQGPEKIVGIFFSIMYTMSKGSDLLSRLKLLRTAGWKLFQNVSLGVSPSKEQLIASGGICAICHEEYTTPVRLHCKHIFCETCVSTWLDRERSCPLCRASITDDPIYRDGHTTHFIQLY